MAARINVSIADGISTIELNDPPANTYSYEMMLEIDAAVLAARMDPNVHVIVLRGAGRGPAIPGDDLRGLSEDELRGLAAPTVVLDADLLVGTDGRSVGDIAAEIVASAMIVAIAVIALFYSGALDLGYLAAAGGAGGGSGLTGPEGSTGMWPISPAALRAPRCRRPAWIVATASPVPMLR